MAEPLRALEELGAEFERVAAAPRARSRPRRVLVLALLAVLLIAAVALAATGVLTGEPVRNPPGVKFTPTTGVGTPLVATARLVGLRVADPDGGPPWALRTVRTTRDMGCVQLGRFADGRLGVLGQDGAFADDGRFHEIPRSVLSQAECKLADGAGHVFLAVSYQGMPASALPAGCAQHGCVKRDMRIIYYGLLGPEARSVTYENERGATVTTRTSGPEGAYLIVMRPTREHPARGYYVARTNPGSGLKSVAYRDGHECRIRPARVLGGAKGCPLVGYVAPRAKKVTSAQVAAPVGVRAVGTSLRVSFRARVRGDAHSYYIIAVTRERVHDCRLGGTIAPVVRDVAPGEVVRQSVSLLASPCHGRLRVTVVFHQRGDTRDPLPFAGAPQHDPRVGTATVAIG
jgi:hypothetical protein